MQFKHFGWCFLAVSLLIFSKAGISQVVPTASAGSGQAFKVGAGASSFDVDWAHGRMLGETVWLDWQPKWIPGRLYGLGIEGEWRDINFNRSSTQPPNLRQDTIGGGAIYNWPHYARFRPYGKFLIAYGTEDFQVRNPAYTTDSRLLYAPGLGFDYRVYRPVWVRVDYEYQRWQTLFNHNPDPQGFTVGVLYSFGARYGR